MDPLTIYSTNWCGDCRRVKMFLKDRGVRFVEINIENDPDAEDLVLKVNHGRRKVPTIKFGEKYFACTPFSAQKLADELGLPLNR